MKYLVVLAFACCLGCHAKDSIDPHQALREAMVLQQSARIDRQWTTEMANIGLPFILFSATSSPLPRAGETVQLQACLKAANGKVRILADSEVNWVSLDKAVATIDSRGLVTLLQPGQAWIFVYCNWCPPFHVTSHIVDTRSLMFPVYPVLITAR